MDYGYRFFITAVNTHVDLKKEQLKELAFAARIAQAESKDWQDFIKNI